MTTTLNISEDEIQISAIRAQGAGGQHVNKVSSAIHLRFDINASSLPELYKQRLLTLSDRRINKDGVIIIKAQQYRTQDKNKTDAFNRLHDIINHVTVSRTVRRPTKPSKNAKNKRMDSKAKRGTLKQLRSRIDD
tara:strand:- start:8171 stop:8575 length:405 start_codon:yes stop_codon:yes gene_type:complete